MAVLLVVNRLCLGAQEVKVQYLKAKIIPIVLHIFQQNESNLLLRSRCLATLANLGSNFPKAVKEMLELDILELSVEMFHRHSDNAQLQSRCLQLLWAFIKEGDQKADEICTQETLDAVLQAVQRHSASEPLLAEAFGFLWNFTKGKEKKDWFFGTDGLQKLFSALEAFPRSSLIQKQGFEVLRSLTLSVKPEHVAQLATDKTMDLAKVAMKGLRHDPRVASAALGVLGNLACSNTQFKKDLFLQDCPQEVLLVMEEHARDVGVQALGTWALSNFVGISRKRARELYELGGKDRIFVAMSEHSLNDTIKAFGPSLMGRLELVQELMVNAVNMEEDEEEALQGKGFAALDASETSKASGDESSEDSEIKAKIQALAQQTQGTESEELHRTRGGVKIRDD